MIEPSANQRVHFYDAHAVALGGFITRPFEEVIEAQAATVLPIRGGVGSARVDNFEFRGIVSFKSARSWVTGSQSEKDGSFATLATVSIEDLNILNVVTVKRIVARITSHHPAPKGTGPSPEPSIIPLGSQIEGLQVAGCPLEVVLDVDTFSTLSTYQSYVDKNPKATESNGVILCSLVRSIKKLKDTCATTVEVQGDSILIPQFGRVILGQTLMARSSRRIAMLQFELGCPVGGSGGSGIVQGNGTTIP